MLRATSNDIFDSFAGQARLGAEKRGRTYVNLERMMFSRYDVLPKAKLSELSKLQDGLKPFDTLTAIEIDIVEKKMCYLFDELLSAISETPVVAASLAQVYKPCSGRVD